MMMIKNDVDDDDDVKILEPFTWHCDCFINLRKSGTNDLPRKTVGSYKAMIMMVGCEWDVGIVVLAG